jgi:cell division protein ZipA
VMAPLVGPELGKRDREEFDKIVTLYVAARSGQMLHGPDIVVAAEKAGLSYGYLNIFHRLVEGRPLAGPIFSVANIKKPGGFEMSEIQSMQTPAIAFFLTLPAPIPALDAWEKLLPTAQRMAELLDGVVLDESRNALGRQRIAHIRDELRAYDRQHEAPPISKNTKW